MLAGVLCLSACLKNYESPEVTALRNARADEIRANAELIRAQTAVENARVAYVNAQTAYENALAATEAARQALIVAETETEKARAAEALAQAQIAQAQAEAALQQAQYEQELAALQQQIDMLLLQQQLADAITDGQIEANDNLLRVLDQYNDARADLLDMLLDEADLEAAIEQLEAIIENPAEAEAYMEELKTKAQKDIAEWETEIARTQKEIEGISKYQTMTEDELFEAQQKARLALIDANTDYQTKYQAEIDAINAFWDARNAVFNNTVYYNLFSDYSTFRNYCYMYAGGINSRWNAEKNYYEYYYINGEAKEVVIWTGYSWMYADQIRYPEAEGGVYEGTVYEWNNPSIKFNGLTVDEKAIEALYKEKRKPYEDDLAAAKAADPADETWVKAATEALADYDAEYEVVAANLKDLAAAKTGFDATVKKAEDAYLAYFEAWKARIDAEQVQVDAQADYNAAMAADTYVDVYGNTRDVASTIANLEDYIEWCEEQIADIEEDLAYDLDSVETFLASLPTYLVQLQEELTELQNRIAIQVKVVDDLEAQLEAMLGAMDAGAEE